MRLLLKLCVCLLMVPALWSMQSFRKRTQKNIRAAKVYAKASKLYLLNAPNSTAEAAVLDFSRLGQLLNTVADAARALRVRVPRAARRGLHVAGGAERVRDWREALRRALPNQRARVIHTQLLEQAQHDLRRDPVEFIRVATGQKSVLRFVLQSQAQLTYRKFVGAVAGR